MPSDCLFCKIVAGVIPSPRVAESDFAIAIRDIHPQAQEHILVIPKVHSTHIDELSLTPDGQRNLGLLLAFATQVARQQGLMPGGYRVVANTNPNGGQSVYHLHFHVLGGEPLSGSFGVL